MPLVLKESVVGSQGGVGKEGDSCYYSEGEEEEEEKPASEAPVLLKNHGRKLSQRAKKGCSSGLSEKEINPRQAKEESARD